MSSIIYENGSTIILKCKFYDENGILINPTTVKLIMYDYKHTKLVEYTVGIQNISVGIYTFHYTIPLSSGKSFIYYEWNGAISGNTAIKRGSITSDFIVGVL